MAKNSSDLSKNPLVNPPPQPFNAPPLGLFELEHVKPAMEYGIEEARKILMPSSIIPKNRPLKIQFMRWLLPMRNWVASCTRFLKRSAR